MNETVALRGWGYSEYEIEELVLRIRDVLGEETTGPSTDWELGRLTMVAATWKLKQAGFDARLRRELKQGGSHAR